MRAGLAIRPRTTSARSSPSPPWAMRRTTRMPGSATSTLRLGEQLVHPGRALSLVPRPFPVGPVADLAAGIDEEGHREALGLPAGCHLLVAVHEDRQVHHLAPEELLHALGGLAVVHAEHLDGLAGEPRAQPLDRGHLIA